MRTLLPLALLALSLGAARPAEAKKSTSGITRPHVTRYYRKSNKPKANTTRGPKHKNNNYDQHGWY
jgi:hypothetical protein